MTYSKVMSVQDIEQCFPWEREIYYNQHKAKLEEEKNNGRK